MREDGRADPRRPGAALATALRRAQRLADDPAGAVWYAARRIFAFALMLMIRDGIPVSEVESAGPDELALVEASGWHGWPPRLPGQPIFYPVFSQEYAVKIARDWNVPHSGAGYVTRFEVRRSFLDQYEVHRVGQDHP